VRGYSYILFELHPDGYITPASMLLAVWDGVGQEGSSCICRVAGQYQGVLRFMSWKLL
jgi:hypothetical protein